LLVIALFVGMAMVLTPFIKQEHELNSGASEYIDLKQSVSTSEPVAKPQPTVTPVVVKPEEEQIPQVSPSVSPSQASSQVQDNAVDFASCLSINQDFIGWITIPGTPIDYPVVQSDNVEHYLSHTFTGEKNKIGTLFTLGKTDLITPSQNIAIYGHHMRKTRAQTMFEPLHNYKKAEYYHQHPIIEFNTIYHSGTYTIFAACNMRATEWDPSLTSFSDPMAFMHYIEMLRSRSFFDSSVEVNASDQLLTLITCDRNYDSDDGRLIVLAVKNKKE